MKIDVKSIKGTLGAMMDAELSVSLSDEVIQGRKVSFIDPGNLSLTVINSNDEYVITGKAELSLNIACSRCLDDFKMDLEFDFNEEVPKEEVQDDEINLRASLLEHIRLAIPMQTVCNEGCKGLCPGCGINLNIDECNCIMHKVDPRLAKLEKLLNKE